MYKFLIGLFLFAGLTFASPVVHVTGTCGQGGASINFNGSLFSPKAVGSYPGCTVRIYNTGTSTFSAIYSDNAGTIIKANPFTADLTTGNFDFYIDPAIVFDFAYSGGGIVTPFTISAQTPASPSGEILDIVYKNAGLPFTTLCSDAATANKTVVISTSWTLNSSSCAANLQFITGGIIKPASGQTITFTVQSAGLVKICDTSLGGKCAISASIYYPQWWGGVIGADSTAAINAATAAVVQAAPGSKTLHFTQGTWNTTTGISIGGAGADNVTMECDPGTVIQYTGSGANAPLYLGQVPTGQNNAQKVTGCIFSGNATALPVTLERTNRGYFQDLRFVNISPLAFKCEACTIDTFINTGCTNNITVPTSTIPIVDCMAFDWDGTNNSQNITLITPIVEGFSGIGIHGIHAADITAIGGTEEGGGTGVQCETTCTQTTWLGQDLEVNTNDYIFHGNLNTVLGATIADDITTLDGNENTLSGGTFITVIDTGTANKLDSFQYTTLTNSGATSEIRTNLSLFGTGLQPWQIPVPLGVAGVVSCAGATPCEFSATTSGGIVGLFGCQDSGSNCYAGAFTAGTPFLLFSNNMERLALDTVTPASAAPNSTYTVMGNTWGCTHGSSMQIAGCGVATLSGGTVTVGTEAIGALASAGTGGQAIQLTLQSCSSCGILSVGTVTSGSSFVINSSNVSDASTVYWEIRIIK